MITCTVIQLKRENSLIFMLHPSDNDFIRHIRMRPETTEVKGHHGHLLSPGRLGKGSSYEYFRGNWKNNPHMSCAFVRVIFYQLKKSQSQLQFSQFNINFRRSGEPHLPRTRSINTRNVQAHLVQVTKTEEIDLFDLFTVFSKIMMLIQYLTKIPRYWIDTMAKTKTVKVIEYYDRN